MTFLVRGEWNRTVTLRSLGWSAAVLSSWPYRCWSSSEGPSTSSTVDKGSENSEKSVHKEDMNNKSAEAAGNGSNEPEEVKVSEKVDYTKMGFTKRQAAWIDPDPEKHKHFLPKLSRKERGGYGTREGFREFGREIEFFPKVPSNVPLYNLRDAIPEIYEIRSSGFDAMKETLKRNPNASLEDLASVLGVSVSSIPKYGGTGAEPVLEWDLRYVFSPAIAKEEHPANRKARCRIHIRDLQRQTGLSDNALRYIAELSDKRYDEYSGILKLTCDKYMSLDENRREVLNMLKKLIDEGKRLDTNGEVAKNSRLMQNQEIDNASGIQNF